MEATAEKRTLSQLLEAELGPGWREITMAAYWNAGRCRAEMMTPGWGERVRAEARAAVSSRLGGVLADGLRSLASSTEPELLGMITHPRLRQFAEQYDATAGAIVLGPTGVGKSVTGVLAARRLITSALENGRKHGVIWVRAFDLPNARLQQRFGEGEAELVQRAFDAQVLVLDDMGWESKRAGADDVVAEVIAVRYDRGLPSYVTSGLTQEQFTTRYGDAVVRRVVECGGGRGKLVDLWGGTESRGRRAAE